MRLAASACLTVLVLGCQDQPQRGAAPPGAALEPPCTPRVLITNASLDREPEYVFFGVRGRRVSVSGRVLPADSPVVLRKRVRDGEITAETAVGNPRRVRTDARGRFEVRVATEGHRTVDATVEYRFDATCRRSKDSAYAVISLTEEELSQ